VGEGPETWTIKARIFPRRFGGLEDLKKLYRSACLRPAAIPDARRRCPDGLGRHRKSSGALDLARCQGRRPGDRRRHLGEAIGEAFERILLLAAVGIVLMSEVIERITVEGDAITLSLLVWRRFRRPMPGFVEQILDRNPELASSARICPSALLSTCLCRRRANLQLLDPIRLW